MGIDVHYNACKKYMKCFPFFPKIYNVIIATNSTKEMLDK